MLQRIRELHNICEIMHFQNSQILKQRMTQHFKVYFPKLHIEETRLENATKFLLMEEGKSESLNTVLECHIYFNSKIPSMLTF